MPFGPELSSTAQVLSTLRDGAHGLGLSLAQQTVGLARDGALEIAELVEELGREVDQLRLVAARAVDLGSPSPTTTTGLVDHGARPAAPSAAFAGVADGPAPLVPGGGGVDPDSGATGSARADATAGTGEGAALRTGRDDGLATFARARDLLRDRLRIGGREAARRIRMGHLVCERVTTTGEVMPALHPRLAAAVTELSDEAGTEIIRVIERAKAVPAIGREELDSIEATMVEHALVFDPDQLRKIGQHLLAVIDPDGAEPAETEARVRQGIHFGRLRKGLATVRLVVDALQYEVLKTAADAGSNPRTSLAPVLENQADGPTAVDAVGGVTCSDSVAGSSARAPVAASPLPSVPADTRTRPQRQLDTRTRPQRQLDTRTRPQRQLDAVVAAVGAAIRHGVLPNTGGTPTQVIVTIDSTDLGERASERAEPGFGGGAGWRNPVAQEFWSTGKLPANLLSLASGVALLPHAGPISARTVKQLACDATVAAVILGNGRRVLDVGRNVRIVPPWIRAAVAARDGTDCAFPGCTIPVSWCEAHHIVPWRRQGRTSVDNTVLLCPHHHKLMESGAWQIQQRSPGVAPTFTRTP